MGAKLILIFIAVCIVALAVSFLLIGAFFYTAIINFEKNQTKVNKQNNIQPQIDNQNNCTAIDIKGLTSLDDRSKSNSYLFIRGVMNNTGPTVYDASLQVTAYNMEGLAIDKFCQFGGMLGHSTLGLDYRLPYSGSPIINVTLYIVYSSTPRVYNGTFS